MAKIAPRSGDLGPSKREKWPSHEWFIDPREYARQEQRRGRRYAYERLDPRRSALVVVDMVSFFVEQNPYARGIVPRIDRLARGLREAGGRVFWGLPGASTPEPVTVEFFGAEVAAMYAASGGTGPFEERLWPELVVHEDDGYAEKTAASAFFPGRSTLLDQLYGIDNILVTGTVTNVCCESSARDASTLGYRVVMVADANAARRDQDHNATLHTIYRTFGDVRSTDDLLTLLR
ncbi:MAG TPA: isochorismatase family cysteine hydrolase [Nocardioides sp.]